MSLSDIDPEADDFQEQIISQAFNAICINMDLKDFEAAALITEQLVSFANMMTQSQQAQLLITQQRLIHVLKLT